MTGLIYFPEHKTNSDVSSRIPSEVLQRLQNFDFFHYKNRVLFPVVCCVSGSFFPVPQCDQYETMNKAQPFHTTPFCHHWSNSYGSHLLTSEHVRDYRAHKFHTAVNLWQCCWALRFLHKILGLCY